MHAVRADHDAHGSRLTSQVYTRALNVHFYIIDLSCSAYAGYVASIFRDVLNRVVASRVCSQFLIELYRMYIYTRMIKN